jgi:hypothetical protein
VLFSYLWQFPLPPSLEGLFIHSPPLDVERGGRREREAAPGTANFVRESSGLEHGSWRGREGGRERERETERERDALLHMFIARERVLLQSISPER